MRRLTTNSLTAALVIVVCAAVIGPIGWTLAGTESAQGPRVSTVSPRHRTASELTRGTAVATSQRAHSARPLAGTTSPGQAASGRGAAAHHARHRVAGSVSGHWNVSRSRAP